MNIYHQVLWCIFKKRFKISQRFAETTFAIESIDRTDKSERSARAAEFDNHKNDAAEWPTLCNPQKTPFPFRSSLTDQFPDNQLAWKVLGALWWKKNKRLYINDVKQASKYINSNLFRPPYGKLNFFTLISLIKSYKIVLWDVLSGDFDLTIDVNQVIHNVIDNAENGSILVFHDNIKFKEITLSALPEVISILKKRGFYFESIPFSPLW